MKVKFSKLSSIKIENLCNYLENEWSEQSKNKFLQILNSKIDIIKSNPMIFPSSKLEPKLRKCVVTKQSFLLYEIQKDIIYIVNLIDSRQNPSGIKKELDKYII